MFSGNEWLILMVVLFALVLPIMLVVVVVGSSRRRDTFAPNLSAAPHSGPIPLQQFAEAGWFPDPSGRYQHRYWDGRMWSDSVATDGQQGLDRL